MPSNLESGLDGRVTPATRREPLTAANKSARLVGQGLMPYHDLPARCFQG